VKAAMLVNKSIATAMANAHKGTAIVPKRGGKPEVTKVPVDPKYVTLGPGRESDRPIGSQSTTAACVTSVSARISLNLLVASLSIPKRGGNHQLGELNY